MKRNKIIVILGLIFALCCVFIFCGSSFIGAKVNAVEAENEEVTSSVPEGKYSYDADEGVVEITFIDEKTLHLKVALLDGTYKEDDFNYEYNTEKKFYKIIAGDKEKNVLFKLNHEQHTIEEYYPEEDETKIEDTAKEIGIEIEKLVVIIAGILSGLGVSGTFLASFAKWINKKLKKGNEDLSDSKQVLIEAKELFIKSIKESEDAKKYMQEAERIMTEAAEMIKSFYEDTKTKNDEINKVASEILNDGGGEDVSI